MCGNKSGYRPSIGLDVPSSGRAAALKPDPGQACKAAACIGLCYVVAPVPGQPGSKHTIDPLLVHDIIRETLKNGMPGGTARESLLQLAAVSCLGYKTNVN